jgi:hypothetical protein
MFNTDNVDNAKEHFQKHRWCVIDNILKQKYIKEIYKCVPTLNYGWQGYVDEMRGEHHKYSPEKMATLNEVELRNEYRDNTKGGYGYWHRACWLEKKEESSIVIAMKKLKLKEDKVGNKIADIKRSPPGERLITLDNPRVDEFNHVVVGNYNLLKPDPTFMQLGEYISGFTNMYLDNPSYSAYHYTNWLTAHYDPPSLLAFIFYFNETWEAHWGGQLCIMNKDERTIRHSIEPFGNRLLLMDVSKRINRHFISPVSYVAEHPRYSSGGRFHQCV